MHTIKIYKVKNTNEVILNIQDNSLEDIIKIEYIKNWFTKNLCKWLGGVKMEIIVRR